MLPLSPFKDKSPGLPDKINYAALIAPGVVQGKDGLLIAGFFFRGEDSASSTNAMAIKGKQIERRWSKLKERLGC